MEYLHKNREEFKEADCRRRHVCLNRQGRRKNGKGDFPDSLHFL